MVPAIRIDSHRALIAKARQVIKRLGSDPASLRLLVLNPVLAFKQAGIELSPAIADHVLRSVQHPPAVRAEREELEARLREALGEIPRPTSGEWLAHLLFEKLGLKPLDTRGQSPPYASSVDAAAVARLSKLLPSQNRQSLVGRAQIDPTQAPKSGGVVRIGGFKTVNNLDLEVAAPPLKSLPSGTAPKRVTLEELWFYKDQHPIVADSLRLALIQRSALPIHSAASFRRIQQGKVPHPLLEWITGATFATGGDK